ncbi:hypothetical protein HZS_3016, partial [Henneguya salminicola]
MISNYLELTNEIQYSYTIEDILDYASEFSSHWKIKVYIYFSERYPMYKKQLIAEAVKIAETEQIFKIYDKLINYYLDEKKETENYRLNIEQYKINYETKLFAEEEAVRTARIIGVPENLRRYLYDMAMICEAAGDYEECAKILDEAIRISKPNLRPHAIFIKLCQIYLLTNNKDALTDLLMFCKEEKWKNDKMRIQQTERCIIYFLHSLSSKKCTNCIFKFLTQFDPLITSQFIFIISPSEICKLVMIILFSSFNIRDIIRCYQLLNNVPLKTDEKYDITSMVISLKDGNFDNFMSYFNKIIPHIYNDIFINKKADLIIDAVISNMVRNSLMAYPSTDMDQELDISPAKRKR